MSEKSYRDAIREAMMEEMDRDENVLIMGEDIGVYEGTFRITAGMLKRFGPKRVIDTPISESTIMGAAVGMAIPGDLVEDSFEHVDGDQADAVFDHVGPTVDDGDRRRSQHARCGRPPESSTAVRQPLAKTPLSTPMRCASAVGPSGVWPCTTVTGPRSTDVTSSGRITTAT